MQTIVSVPLRYSIWNWNGTGWTFSQSGDITCNRKLRVYTDTVRRVYPLDGFQMATYRQTETTNYSTHSFDWSTGYNSGSKYTNYHVWTMYPITKSRVNGSGVIISDPVTTLSRDAMYNSARSQIHGQKTNLANMLGEYRETAQTFLDLVEVVASRGKSLVKFRSDTADRIGRLRVRRPGSVDVKSTLAKNRLQWQYGLRPLAQDMGTAVAELTTAINTTPPTQQGVIRRKDRVSNSGYRQPNSTIFSRWASSELIIETRYRTQWKAYMNQNALLASLAEHSLLNSASLAWELMPYSFVIDWWFNVGDVLQSLDNIMICDRLMVLDSSSVRRFEYCQPPVRDNVYTRPMAFYSKRTDVRRTPVEISRVASIQYKPSLSLGHILNGMALLQVAAKRA